MRVLVVGGAGYIGSVTVDQLIVEGHSVTVLDSLISGHTRAVNSDAELVEAEVRDEAAVGRVFANNDFDAVINYSGYILAGESVQQPGRYFANNVGGCIALLNAMVTYGVTRFVFSSSAAVYGEPEGVPISEDAPIRPVNPYGETKAIVERMLPWYERQFDLRHVSLRYFNAAGATEERGENHMPESHLIPNVLQVAQGEREVLTLFGTDYPTPDGTCVRDYIHVSDLADAHLRALKRTEDGSGAYNLGNGHGFSNREVIDAASRVVGEQIPVEERERRPGDPASLVASNALAAAELGWHPEVTDIEEIIASAWRWHSAHPKGYSPP
ncbi:MAG: UDP-glucose 4-epimerase GalE [Chloroflexi bacterium]|nr:UDP-glucose 4-epimerase GalE [Chloroflexota bacterium]